MKSSAAAAQAARQWPATDVDGHGCIVGPAGSVGDRVRERVRSDEVCWRAVADLPAPGEISPFGQDADGELDVLALDEGVVYRIDAA